MTKALRDVIPSKRTLIGALSLLGSGAVAAVGFALISSDRWNVVDPSDGVFIILFVQWQTLALTVAKLGIEQIVFAAITHDRSMSADITNHFRRRTVPLALLMGALVAVVFSPLAGLICAVSVILDTHSAVMLASEGARERLVVVALANAVNYPLFFIGLACAFAAGVQGPSTALVLFLATSFIRWSLLRTRQSDVESLPPIECRADVGMGLQQLLNYWLFKADQLLLGYSAIALVLTVGQPADALRKFLFLARFPELVSGVVLALGAILLPRLFVTYPIRRTVWQQRAKLAWPIGGAYVVSGIAGVMVYAAMWRGSPMAWWLPVLFGLGALFILPSYVLTYSMIRQGYLRGLMRNQVISLAAGLAVVAVSIVTRTLAILALLVPVQLATYVLLCITFSWSLHRPLFGNEPAPGTLSMTGGNLAETR